MILDKGGLGLAGTFVCSGEGRKSFEIVDERICGETRIFFQGHFFHLDQF